MQLVLDFQETPFLHRRALSAVVACLEILRRGIWNFFRYDLFLCMAPKVHFLRKIFTLKKLLILTSCLFKFLYRMENEHLNNVENYRAFKSVPLPFYYDEDKSV